jgi:hypothetical protein
MKHLKYINEMDQWATSNRLGGDSDDNRNIEQFVKEYLEFVDGHYLTVVKFNNAVIAMAVRLHLSQDDVTEILNKKLKISEYLITALERYKKEYNIQ